MSEKEINYSDLKLEINNNYKTFDWAGKAIEIFEYVPLQYKYNIVTVTLQESLEEGYYNPVLVDTYFHLNLFLTYVRNINFTQEEKLAAGEMYDKVYSSGLMKEFLKNINEEEYNTCYNYLNDTLAAINAYRTSAPALLSNFINNLPKKAEDAVKILKEFNPDELQEITKYFSNLGLTTAKK